MTRRIGVLGIGTLGITVAQLVLDTGDEAVLIVREGRDKRARGAQALERSLAREVRVGRLDERAATNARNRAIVTDDVGALASCDVVVECLPEELAVKQRGLATVEPHLASHALFASATSSLPAKAISARAARPGRVAIAHYVWPANRTGLVEVAFPDGVDADVPDLLLDLIDSQKKQPLLVRDVPGFLITRAVMAYWGEAVEVVAEGVSPVDIDAAFEQIGWPIGPCRLLDGANLHTAVRVAEAVRPVMDGRLDGIDRLQSVVAAGFIGYAAGAGLYVHEPPARMPNERALALLRGAKTSFDTRTRGLPSGTVERITTALVREVEYCLDEGVVASWEDAALGIDLAYGFAGGLLRYAPHRRARRSA
jgi:3-hydroxyacyl-CoA dehydrogenase/enoyl-CoA hydratase/3-hydroxybutyryl-CoA epimerase